MKTLNRVRRSHRILFAVLVAVPDVMFVPALASAGTLLPRDHAYLQADFEAVDALRAWKGEGRLETGYRGGRALAIESQAGGAASASLVSVTLPVEAMRGYLVRGSAMVRAENVSSKPKAWNGIKCMLAIETPGRKLWPQANMDTGTFDWRQVAFTVRVPTNATSATLVLGLEQATGKVWFDDVRAVVAKPPISRVTKPVVGPAFTGHNLPRLRGAMISPNIDAEGLRVLGREWNVNLVRWQLVRHGRAGQPASLEDYDAWLEGELKKLDAALPLCEQNGLYVVVDLHSPPGGKATSGGYVGSDDRFFTDPACQAKFVELWQRMATRYQGARAIWGFDLVNEPVERHGWDWSYHAFREWSGWSVEHGSDRNNTKPSAEPTNRQRLLQQWFKQNRKPAWSGEGHDWPCWRGPERNGVSREEAWGWPRGLGDPAVLWRASVGRGFSSFAVADGWVYTVGNTEDQDTVYCLAADTGTVRWRHTYPCELQPLSYEGGPSATPAVDGQRVYTFSKGGDLFSLNARDGTVVWSKKFSPWPYREGDWRNTWRYAGSPLVLGDRLCLSLGEAGTAFNKGDGAVVWESAAGHPGYSSPVPFETPTGEALAFFSGRAVYGVDRSSGRQLWSIPWKTLWDLNAADPIIHDGRMFVSSGNGVGCALFDISVTPPRECWRNKNLKSTINTAVFWQGHVYGFNDTHLSCLSWETGEERWSTRDVRNGSLIVASNRLILVSETGKLVVAEASPHGYQPLAQAQMLEGRCWTTPVLSHGRLFVRNAAGQVVCLDLRRT